jgi:chromosome segregation ATPase
MCAIIHKHSNFSTTLIYRTLLTSIIMIKSNAVAHFETLTREKASFEQAAKRADAERAAVQSRIQQLRKKKEHLLLASRKLSDTVGQLHQQKTSYTNEKARLQAVMRQERAALEECAAKAEALATQERSRTAAFCDEMSACNDELGQLLLQQEDGRLKKLLLVETLPGLETMLLQQKQHQHGENNSPNAAASNDDAPPPSLGEDWNDAAAQLREATHKYKCVESVTKILQGKVQKLRQAALSKHGADSNNNNSNMTLRGPLAPQQVC